MKKLNQEFSNSIEWINILAEENVQQYFDNNCQKTHDEKLES